MLPADPSAETVASSGTQLLAPLIPELFFGFVSAVGTPLALSETALRLTLAARGYDLQTISLHRLTEALSLTTPAPDPLGSAYQRKSAQMDRGNEARASTKTDSILAGLAVAQVNGLRVAQDEKKGLAIAFRQLKHPEEAYLFRQIYDEGFHLIGCHCSRETRKTLLENKGMSEDDASQLIERDEFEATHPHGQRVRKTFPLSDVFVRITGDPIKDPKEVKAQLTRFGDLLFGEGLRTPTRDEYGMYLAAASALRSAQLSRQVGASILSPGGEVLALGTNEVPAAQGGSYWEGDLDDCRDHKRGVDSTDEMRENMLVELLDHAIPKWRASKLERQQKLKMRLRKALDPTRVMNLTEFTRATHAEMDAILSAGRQGIPVVGATLYTTTFPCHNCMKHIVAAGISRVVYIEPYPKSMAIDLHGDAIILDPNPDEVPVPTAVGSSRTRVRVEPFVGIAPRRYYDFFTSMTRSGITMRRKDARGRPDFSEIGLRLRMPTDWYMQREGEVAKEYLNSVAPEVTI